MSSISGRRAVALMFQLSELGRGRQNGQIVHLVPPSTDGKTSPDNSQGDRVPEISSPATTARYLAQPHEVHRVVLLYSGGLDTSVMLRWIQEQYDAQVIALCIDLGQPADDFDAVRQKALDLGATLSLVVDAKEEFARDYVAPSI